MPLPAPNPQRRLPRWPVASLRAYLVLLIVMASVPLAAFSIYLLQQQAVAARQSMVAAVDRTTEAFALLVEREITSSVDLLSGLAYHEALQRGDTAGFYEAIARGSPLRPAWRGVYLAEPDGTVVFTSDQPYGRRLGRLRDEASIERIRTSLEPTVTDLVVATENAELVTGVQVPVMVRGNLRFVLGARIAASHWQHLVERAAVAPGGFIALVDGQSRVVAHNLHAPTEVGHVRSIERLAQVHGTSQGWQFLVPSDEPSVVSRQPVRSSRWEVAAGVAAAPLIGDEASTLASMVAAGAISLLLGLALALTVSRRVSEPLGQLAEGGAAAVRDPVVVREISALRAALEAAGAQSEAARVALQRKADEFEALFSSSPVGLALTLDAEGSRALINPALAALLGTRPGVHTLEPLLQSGEPSAPLVMLDGRALTLAEQPMQRASAHGEVAHGVALQLRHADGRVTEVEVHAVPLRDTEGTLRGAVAAFVDATDRRRLEQQREAALEAAETANRGKDEFLAMLGHELRNPLGAIGAAVEVLNRSKESQPEMAQSARRVIERQTRQMVQLINDLQDVARVGAGKLTLQKRRLDLAQLVWRPLDALRLAGRLKGHALVLDLQHVWVEADPVRIEQVMVNLLTNAGKYTPAGGRIELRIGADGPHALIEVRDTGMGIAENQLPHVFELFVQGDRTAGVRQGGIGLGLTLVRRLIELHGGTVHASSAGPNLGSTFTLRLPALHVNVAAGTATAWAGRRAAVIGFGESAPLGAESMLCAAGCRVTTVADGSCGLDVLLEDAPDLALIDLALPSRLAEALASRTREAGLATRLVGVYEDTLPGLATGGFDLLLRSPIVLQDLQPLIDDAPDRAAAS